MTAFSHHCKFRVSLSIPSTVQLTWSRNRSHPANFTSPTSTSATGQPPSFKTNVNRAKTKRWVEAKSVSYDGDDWGDDDEYDDYGDYDEPPPPNPTGYRQQGQVPSVSPVQMSASPGGFGTPSLPQPGTVFNDHRRRYGDLPGQSPRVMSNPQLGSGVGRDRSNSFDEGDEKRAFSAGGQQPAPAPEFAQQPDFVESPTTQAGQTPATRFSQMGIGMPSPDPAKSKDLPPIPPMPENVQGRHPSPKQAGHGPPPLQVQTQPVTSTPSHPVEGFTSPVSTSSANYRGAAYPNNQRRTSSASRTRSIDSTTASDFQARRDFSPTALPPPLQTRASPAAPVSEVSSPSQFPPRKSSLSQKNPSYFPSESRGSPGGFIVQSPPSAPSRRESGSSIGRSRAGSNPGVSQPFVRPADIYRRVEEERQKERQSSESGRPSMDSIMRRTSDHDFASGSSDVRKEPSSENLRRGIAKKPSREDSEETETSRRLKPMLDPVTERRSEYGFDALLVNSQGSVGSHTEAPNLGQSRSPDNLEPPSTDPRRGVSEDSSAREQGRTPSLPQVNRVSGFGDDFWPATRHSPHSSETTAQPQPPVNSFQIDGGHSHAGTSGPPLNHQESQGFRSVVRQAFDRQDDPSVPPTPSSISGSQRSQDGSGVSRTDSHSTAGISPIMSRVPSAATALGKAKEAEAREAATPAIAEEPTTPEFKRETESTLSTPRNQSRKPSPSPNRRAPDDTRPAVFMPGHRRNQSTPSPRGSPARSPAVGVSHQVAEGEHAEIVQAQHTDARSLEHTSNSMASSLHHGRNRGQSLDYATREADVATAVNSNRHNEASETANSVSDAQSLFLDTRVNQNNSSRSTTPISRADSPSKGKVRDLAGRFDSNQSPISASPTRGPNQPSSSKSSPAPSFTPRLQDLTASRPATDRMQSFRPALPGGWVSYATTAGPGTPVSEVDPGRSGAVTEQNSRSTPTESPDTAKEDMDITPTTASRTLSGSSQQQEQGEDHSRGAFAAVAAAGAAMAEAITAAVGIENEPSQGTVGAEAKLPAREPSSSSEDSSLHASNDHTPTRDYQAHLPQPDEVASSSTDSATSSRPPTPPPKDTPLLPDGHSTSGYFPPTVPLSYRHTAGRSDVNMPPITTRPPMLPSLSTETSPNDQESDRLRKEIVRTLSPTSANLDPAPGFPSSVPTGASDSRESTLFPSEYESYWASAGEEDWAVQQRQLPQVQEERSTSPAYPHNQPSPTSSENRALRDSDATSSAHGMPSTSQDEGPALVADDHTQDRDRQKIDIASKPLGHSRGLSEVSHDAELSQLLGTRNAYFDQAQGREIRKEHNTGALHVINSDYEEPPTPDSSGKNRVEASPNQPMDGLQSVEREPASVTEQYRGPAGQFFEPGLELADENERREQGSSDSPSNPWGAIPGHGKQKGYTSQEKDIGLEERSAWAGAGDENEKSSLPRSSEEHTSPLAGVPPIPFDAAEAQPTPTQAAPQPKIPTFREILARKSAADRIHGYNLAREHVANVDSGLSHWLAITASQKPDLLPASAQPGINAANLANSKTSPTQATFGKGSPTSSQQPPQPYYQQYLSAQSSASTGPPVPGKGNMNTPASGTSQSFVGSGSGKLSSREVQAKGKDLLHTAGIFGGKANVAAKGLFAKGRSRFKGAGGDKVDN